MRLLLAAVILAAMLPAQGAKAPVKIVGDSHKLILFSDGTVGGWGDSRDGQLGPRSAIPNVRGQATAFVPIAVPRPAVDIAAGGRSSYVLLDDGTVVAFGYGTEGQLGCGEPCLAGSETPVPVAGLRDVVSLAARQSLAFAVHRDGSISTWGDRKNATPVRFPHVPAMKQISVGNGFVLALTTEGRVWLWGKLPYGRVYTDDPVLEPAEVPGLTEVAAVVATRVAAVLKKDGTVWVWGNNEQAQFGNGKRDVDDRSGVPLRVPGVANVTALAGGTGRHFLALLKDGSLRGWGNTDWGQVGNGRTGEEQASPAIPKIAGVKAVFAAGNNSYAIRHDGSLWIWGVGSEFAREWPMKANAPVPIRLEIPAGIVKP